MFGLFAAAALLGLRESAGRSLCRECWRERRYLRECRCHQCSQYNECGLLFNGKSGPERNATEDARSSLTAPLDWKMPFR